MLLPALLQQQPDQRTREILIGQLLLDYGFLSRDTIGESRCGRPIDLLHIGHRRQQVLLTGCFHGMEWLTTLLLLRFVDELCFAVMTGRSLCVVRIGTFLNRRGLAIVPCVNPDGAEIQLHGADSAGAYRETVLRACQGDTSHWQANAAGVDINHNFAAGWESLHEREQEEGIVQPCATRYGGEYPESEPESRTIASYCRTGHIAHALAFHSQGEEIYWHYGSYRDHEAHRMAKMLSYVSGYPISEPTGLAVGGGFKDWFVDKFHRPAFTIEIGRGTNPLPVEDLDAIYRQLREMLVLAVVL